jgi:hypothetical protein
MEIKIKQWMISAAGVLKVIAIILAIFFVIGIITGTWTYLNRNEESCSKSNAFWDEYNCE